MKSRNHPILRENHDAVNVSPNPKSKPPSTPNPNPTPTSTPGNNRKFKSTKENAPPPSSDSNSNSKIKSPLPPRPPLKRKLTVDAVASDSAPTHSLDSGVKVIVRVRPPNKEEDDGGNVIQKNSHDSLTISGQTFTFDSIADIHSKQSDIFELVGAPLIENCLAGFNSSVFAYGQTGSGKTYTIWGASNALLDEDQQGLAPRVFHRLFERINEEQVKQADRQLVYTCRCSFLEIYNEQITDLLDPRQKNLQIREDVKAGVYVENLREECVSSMEDVSQLLIKGLSNRRTGATCVNSESSRSHSVFTCVVESRFKRNADGLSHMKSSRINFVDLAGSERQKQTGAAGERLKEAGNINRSLSQLGNLINILAEVSQTGKQRHIPYRDSKLTFLLQESLGGNAKLAMICAISPSQSCKSETFSTLRFAQRAKAIKNKAVVNEEVQDDVNVLREVIRQLRDELHRMKANPNQAGQAGAYATGWNARRSLNLLKFSLNRPMMLPHTEDDSDEEMEIVNTDVMVSLIQVTEDRDVNMEDVTFEIVHKDKDGIGHGVMERDEGKSEVTLDSDSHGLSTDERDPAVVIELPIDDVCRKQMEQYPSMQPSEVVKDTPEKSTIDVEGGAAAVDLSASPTDAPHILKSPTPTVSPRLNNSRKSLKTSSTVLASKSSLRQNDLRAADASIAKPCKSLQVNSLSTRKSCFASTEQLAATLHRGLEIIENQRPSPALRRSSYRFSCMPADLKAVLPVMKVDVGIQTISQEDESVETDTEHVCSKCKTSMHQQEFINDGTEQNLQLVPVNGSPCKTQVPKAVEKVLAGAIRREMALEEMCAKQNFEIMQLQRLVQQYKHERECNAIIGQTREDKIVRLESLMDGVLPTEEYMEEELLSLTHEHKILQKQYDNHPDVLRTKIELRRVQDELERYQNFFDLGERDVLLEEINDLRTQLRFYLDSSAELSKRQSPLLHLTSSGVPSVVPAVIDPAELTENAEKRLEQERIQWAEAESQWISLVEELKRELEANRLIAQKQRQELEIEKTCSEELKEAMQMAMEGHARMLEQYAELEEKHIELLAKHRKIHDGINDIKKAAAKAGVKGAESRFINALAAEISALRVEREKERQHFRNENRGLQAQLRDTAEAVQAAGELLVRLKEAEEAVVSAEKRVVMAEQETENAYMEIDKLNKLLGGKEEVVGGWERHRDKSMDEQWQEEFAPSYDVEAGPSSWFSGYDRCNI